MAAPSGNIPGNAPISGFLERVGDFGSFLAQLGKGMVTAPFHGRELLAQMDELGARSLPLVLLASASTGVVLSLQTRASLLQFGAKSLLPAVIVMTISKESGPVITALVLCGRIGAGIGAQLGAMAVTEQLDAIAASAVNPFRLLVVPRVLACILMLPFLTVLADASGILAGWLAQALIEPVALSRFLADGLKGVSLQDLLLAIGRTAVFGLIIGSIGCFQGMRTRGGTEGVARSATSAVVVASLLVILADVGLVRLIQILGRS